MRPGFDPIAHAREVLVPILHQICDVLDAEQARDAHAFFSRALASVEACRDVADLAGPFMQLSTSAFLGFHFSPRAALLIDALLEQSQHLAEVLAIDEGAVQ